MHAQCSRSLGLLRPLPDLSLLTTVTRTGPGENDIFFGENDDYFVESEPKSSTVEH